MLLSICPRRSRILTRPIISINIPFITSGRLSLNGDKYEAYGIARKRVDVRDRQSQFNAKRKIAKALRQVIDRLDVKHIIVSFSDEGYISKDEMIELLSARGDVRVIAKDYKRYVGAQIGIYSPSGDQVGEVSHLKNTEYLFVVSPLSSRLISST